MQTKLLASFLCLAAGIAAQSQQIPLPAFSNTFSGTSTRGFFFQTPVDITIVGLRVPDEAAAGVQNVEVSALAGAPPAYPATASGGQVFYAANVPSSYIIPCNLTFGAGSWVGVMGACGTTTLRNSYGAGSFATTIGGQPATLSRFLTQTNLNTAGGQPYSSEGTGNIARVEVYYTTPAVPGVLALPGFGSTFSSASLTRGLYFQTPVPIIIRGIRVPDESREGTQVVEVTRSATPPPTYPATQSGGQVFYANNVPSYEVIPCFLPFQAGDWVSVLGACGTTTMRNSYATPAGPFLANIGGNPVTLTRCGTQTNLHSTGGNAPIWSETGGAIGRVEIYYELASGFADATNYGYGCNRASRSFYELFSPAGTFDLNNRVMTLTPSGSRYLASQSGAFFPPSGSATVLALSDDSTVAVPLSSSFPYFGGNTSTLHVCSNGFVSMVAGNGNSFSPNVDGWLNSLETRFGDWHDFNPASAGSGPVVFEQVGNRAIVTWNGVYDFAVPNPNTWQLQFNLATGQVTYAWQTMSGTGNAHLVGYAAASGASVDYGSVDITALLPGGFGTSPVDAPGLRLSASARPVIGTSINLDTANIPVGAPFGASLMGFVASNLDLGGLGAPTCSQYVNTLATNIFLVAGPTASSQFIVPNNPFLLGLHVYAQSAAYAPGQNALSVVFSNGTDLLLDLL